RVVHEQDRVLGHEAHEHDHADHREQVEGVLREQEGAEGAGEGDWQREHDRQRVEPGLVQRHEQHIDQQDRDRERGEQVHPRQVGSCRRASLAIATMLIPIWPSTWSCVTAWPVVPAMAVRSALPTWLAVTPTSAIRSRSMIACTSGWARSASL